MEINLVFQIISAAVIVFGAVGLGYWKAYRNVSIEKITEIVINELARDGYVITYLDENNEVMLAPIHPKYDEMILLWEKTLKDADEEIEKAYR